MNDLITRLNAQLTICKANKDLQGIAIYEKALHNVQERIKNGSLL